MKFLLGCCFLFWSVSVCGLVVPGFPPDTGIVFKSASGLDMKLNIHFPEGHRVEKKRAAILLFFGGGWNGGDIEQLSPHADTLAKLGMIAMTPDYRVKNGEGTEPWQAVEDAKSAMRFVRQNAQALGIDTSRILAGGASAGGHLAAALATVSEFNASGEDALISTKPKALVLYNPVYDNGPTGYGYDRVQAYWETFSPLHNIDDSHPPTIHFFGSKDQHASEPIDVYDSTLKSLNIESQFFVYENQTHGFFNYPSVYYDSTIHESIRFLDSYGFFEVTQDSVEEKDSAATNVKYPLYKKEDRLIESMNLYNVLGRKKVSVEKYRGGVNHIQYQRK